MPVNPLSIFVLVFIVWMVSQAINSIRRHREEAQESAVDRKIAEALQEKSAVAGQTARAEINDVRVAADAKSAEVNNDRCVVIPFRGGPGADTNGASATDAEPLLDPAADAVEEAPNRDSVGVEDKPDPTAAIFARDNSYAEYQEPTVYRRSPGWKVIERDWAVPFSPEEPVATEADAAELQERWADYVAMLRDDGSEGPIRLSREQPGPAAQKELPLACD